MRISAITTAYFEIDDEDYKVLSEDEVGEAIQDGRIKPVYINVHVSDGDGKILEDYTMDEGLLTEIGEGLKKGE